MTTKSLRKQQQQRRHLSETERRLVNGQLHVEASDLCASLFKRSSHSVITGWNTTCWNRDGRRIQAVGALKAEEKKSSTMAITFWRIA